MAEVGDATQRLVLPGATAGTGGGGCGAGRGDCAGGGGGSGAGEVAAVQALLSAPADPTGHAVTVTAAPLETCTSEPPHGTQSAREERARRLARRVRDCTHGPCSPDMARLRWSTLRWR